MPLHLPAHKIFNEIYTAAKSKNGAKLCQLRLTASLNVCNESHQTAITKLAVENDSPSVCFLLAFEASIYDAILGYAQGGHIKIVDLILMAAQQKTDNISSDISFIAFINDIKIKRLNEPNVDQSEHTVSDEQRLLELGLSLVEAIETEDLGFDDVSPDIYQFICEKLTNGIFYESWEHVKYAINENNYGTVIADLLFQVDNCDLSSDEFDTLLEYVAKGFALGGHKSDAYMSLEKIRPKSMNTYAISIARNVVAQQLVNHFSQSGNETDAYELLKSLEICNKEEVANVLEVVAYGIALNGTASTIEKFLQFVAKSYTKSDSIQYTVFENLAYGFAQNGDSKSVSYIIDRKKRECNNIPNWELPVVACIYAKRGLINEAFDVLEKMKQLVPSPTICERQYADAVLHIASGLMISNKKGAYALLKDVSMGLYRQLDVRNILNAMAEATDDHGRYALLEHVSRNYSKHATTMIDIIYNTEKDRKNFNGLKKTLVLMALSVIDDPLLRRKIAEGLNNKKYCNNYSAEELLTKAESMHAHMTSRLNMYLFIYSLQKTNELPFDVNVIILTYLLPIDIYTAYITVSNFNAINSCAQAIKSPTKLGGKLSAVKMIDFGLKLSSGSTYLWFDSNKKNELRSNTMPYSDASASYRCS